MSDRAECPGCNNDLSRILYAFREGEDCPVCGLPAAVAMQVMAARERGVNAEIEAKFVAAEQRATKAESKARELSRIVSQISRLVADAESWRS